MLLAAKDYLPSYIKEQAEYRAYLCQPCLNAGKCPHCGCKAPGLFYAPQKEDKLNKWGPMLNKEEWEVQKKNLDYFNGNANNNDAMDIDDSEG